MEIWIVFDFERPLPHFLLMERLFAIIGILVFCLLAYCLSSNRKKVSKALIYRAIGFQFLLALLLLGIPSLGVPGVLGFLFEAASGFFMGVIAFAEKGAQFVAGPMLDVSKMGGYIFAVQVLPIVIFFSSLMAVLYHYGIMQKVVGSFARIMRFVLPISGPEALASSANIFVGQTEAPLVIRPYVNKMTYSELHCLMVGGMATVAGSVLAAFVQRLSPFVADIGGHLLTASVISAPAAIMFAKIMVPEEEEVDENESLKEENLDTKKANGIEAAAEGASTGMKMAINIVAMLIAFVALVAMANKGFELVGELIHFAEWGHHIVPDSIWKTAQGKLSLEMILSILFMPFAFLIGIPANDIAAVSSLLGEKIIINEFYAFMHLGEMAGQLSERSIIITSYALCGFANFSSIGIQIGGIGEIAPERKKDLAKLGIRAMVGGSLAAFSTACIANILL